MTSFTSMPPPSSHKQILFDDPQSPPIKIDLGKLTTSQRKMYERHLSVVKMENMGITCKICHDPKPTAFYFKTKLCSSCSKCRRKNQGSPLPSRQIKKNVRPISDISKAIRDLARQQLIPKPSDHPSVENSNSGCELRDEDLLTDFSNQPENCRDFFYLDDLSKTKSLHLQLSKPLDPLDLYPSEPCTNRPDLNEATPSINYNSFCESSDDEDLPNHFSDQPKDRILDPFYQYDLNDEIKPLHLQPSKPLEPLDPYTSEPSTNWPDLNGVTPPTNDNSFSQTSQKVHETSLSCKIFSWDQPEQEKVSSKLEENLNSKRVTKRSLDDSETRYRKK